MAKSCSTKLRAWKPVIFEHQTTRREVPIKIMSWCYTQSIVSITLICCCLLFSALWIAWFFHSFLIANKKDDINTRQIGLCFISVFSYVGVIVCLLVPFIKCFSSSQDSKLLVPDVVIGATYFLWAFGDCFQISFFLAQIHSIFLNTEFAYSNRIFRGIIYIMIVDILCGFTIPAYFKRSGTAALVVAQFALVTSIILSLFTLWLFVFGLFKVKSSPAHYRIKNVL